MPVEILTFIAVIECVVFGWSPINGLPHTHFLRLDCDSNVLTAFSYPAARPALYRSTVSHEKVGWEEGKEWGAS